LGKPIAASSITAELPHILDSLQRLTAGLQGIACHPRRVAIELQTIRDDSQTFAAEPPAIALDAQRITADAFSIGREPQ
jgi:hypothetical protein